MKTLIGAAVAMLALAVAPSVAAASAKPSLPTPNKAAAAKALAAGKGSLPTPSKAAAAKALAPGTRAAAAAAGCTSNGPTVTDFSGARWSTRYCHNYRSGYVWAGNSHSGYLYAGTNWFVCQSRGGENPPVGNARNNIWLYTQGDVGYSYRGWGWFPATHVSGGVNYGAIPGLRWC